MTTYKNMKPADVERMCGDGEGHLIGLPAVPHTQISNAVAYISRHIKFGTFPEDDCALCLTLTFACTECEEEHPSEADDHVLAGPFVVIGCEGYHFAALRVGYQMLLED